MSIKREFAKDAAQLVLSVLALSWSPIAIAGVVVPAASLLDIGREMWGKTPQALAERAITQMLDVLGQTEVTKDQIMRAHEALEMRAASTLSQQDLIAAATHPNGLNARVVELLMTRVTATDQDLRHLVERALGAGVAAMTQDHVFRDSLNDELVCTIAGAVLRMEQSLRSLREDYGTLAKALRTVETLHKRDLESLAQHFKMPEWRQAALGDMVEYLRDKGDALARLEKQAATLAAKDKRYHNILTGAKEALRQGDIPAAKAAIHEARESIRALDLMPVLERDAEFAELEADAALEDMDPEEAFAILSNMADRFKPVDTNEAARRMAGYHNRLFQHGLRYGGAGLGLAAQMLQSTLALLDKDKQLLNWAAMQNNFGNALRAQGERISGTEGERLLVESVAAFRDVLLVCSQIEHPLLWAHTQSNLGNALLNQVERNPRPEGGVLLGEAIAAFRNALQVRSEGAHPLDWAGTQNNLGNALRVLGTRSAGSVGTGFLAEAVAAYRNALRVYKQDVEPLCWATVQINLGVSLRNQGERSAGQEGVGLLAESTTAYRDALIVYTQEAYPLDWAGAQNNLGNVLRLQGALIAGTEGAAILAEAVSAFRAALRVRTQDTLPLYWAITRSNLGSALQTQGERISGAEGVRILVESVTAFRDVLQVYSQDAHLLQWALTQENIAISELALAEHGGCPNPFAQLRAALEAVENALQVFSAEEISYNYVKASELRERICAKLAGLDDEG